MGKNNPCSYRPTSLTLVSHGEAAFRLEELLVLGRGMEKRSQEKKPLSPSFGPAQGGLNMRRKISVTHCWQCCHQSGMKATEYWVDTAQHQQAVVPESWCCSENGPWTKYRSSAWKRKSHRDILCAAGKEKKSVLLPQSKGHLLETVPSYPRTSSKSLNCTGFSSWLHQCQTPGQGWLRSAETGASQCPGSKSKARSLPCSPNPCLQHLACLHTVLCHLAIKLSRSLKESISHPWHVN